jgi:hypothetical protein
MSDRRKSKSPLERIVDPDLYVFLRRELLRSDGRLGRSARLDKLAEDWRCAFGGHCTGGRLDQWFRTPLRLTQANAERLLALGQLQDRWANFKASPAYLAKSTDAFGYKSTKYGHVREICLEEALANGLTPAQIAHELVKIDGELFDHFGDPSWVGSEEDWHEVIIQHPETWRIWLTDQNEILAYWMFVTPKPEFFNRGCLGDYPEYEIKPDTLQPIDSGSVQIYGPAMYVRKSVSEHFMRQVFGASIVCSFLYHLKRLSHAGIEIADVCVPVYSPEGEGYALMFDVEKMPSVVNRRYAGRMGWASTQGPNGELPALYLGSFSLREPEVQDAGGGFQLQAAS